MIKVFRYSCDGFVPKKQTYHMNLFKSFNEPMDLTGLNSYQISLINEAYLKAKIALKDIDLSDWDEGCFAFIGTLPSAEEIRFELNHLRYEDLIQRKLFFGEISEDSEIYTPYNLIPKKHLAKDVIQQNWSGCAIYIPKKVIYDHFARTVSY